MSKKRQPLLPLIKVRSKINSDIYYTSTGFPEKFIDGEKFISVKRFPADKGLHWMRKENIVPVSNE